MCTLRHCKVILKNQFETRYFCIIDNVIFEKRMYKNPGSSLLLKLKCSLSAKLHRNNFMFHDVRRSLKNIITRRERKCMQAGSIREVIKFKELSLSLSWTPRFVSAIIFIYLNTFTG